MTISVGSASWTDPTLIESKRFYPPGCTSAEARLRFYATQFPLVEVDSSYYPMPSASNSVLWAERTPPHFTFNIKAFRLFTGHQTDRSKLPKDIQAALPPSEKKNLYYRDTPGEILRELWRRYIEAIEPLRKAGKLGAVHFQFAPRVVNDVDGCWCSQLPLAMSLSLLAPNFPKKRHEFRQKRGNCTIPRCCSDTTTERSAVHSRC